MNFITLRHAKARQNRWLAESLSEQDDLRTRTIVKMRLIRKNKPLLGQKIEKEIDPMPVASLQS